MKQKSVFLTIAVLLGLRIAASAQTPPSYVPTNGLVGWWPFNGNANDESGNGNNGTLNGAMLTEDRFGNANASYGFDGVDDFISIYLNSIGNSFAENTAVTLVAWVKTSDSDGPIIALREPAVFNFNIGTLSDIVQNPGYYGVMVRDDVTCCGTGNNVFGGFANDNQWHLLSIIRYDDGSLHCLKDGVLEATSPAGQSGSLSFTEGYMGIGAELYWINGGPECNSCNSIDQQHLNGQLDDIGIWNRALTPEEIIAIYNSEVCSNDLSISLENITANLGGSALLIANTSDVNPIYTWQTDFGQGFQNVLDYGSYSGASTSTLTMSGLQLMNHNQPIRVISIADECVDTSNVVLISIADTCITNVIETSYITVTDTLIINLNPTGFNPVTYANTILMYPNPTSDELTINYGDFASIAGYALKIFNSMGQEIHSANINQQQEVLQLGTWGGAGTYQVVIYNAQGVPVDTRAIVLQ
jgi:hypothetical protein